MDRPRPRRGGRPGDLPRALRARLPGRGPLPEAPLRRGQPPGGRGAGRRASARWSRWSASPSRSPAAATSATPTTRSPCSPAARCAPSTARTASPTTRSSTSSATSSPATEPATIEVAGTRVGLTICEDCWVEGPPASTEAAAGAELIANPSGSPYHRGKGREREAMFAGARPRLRRPPSPSATWSAARTSWSSTATASSLDRDGEVIARAAQFEEELLVCEVPSRSRGPTRRAAARPRRGLRGAGPRPARLRRARTASATSASRSRAGIDSALVALLAVDAVGPEHVSCVVMPSPHSSPETQADARTIAANLGVEAIEIPIAAAMASYERGAGRRRSAPRPTAPTPSRCPATRPAPPSPTWPPRTSRRGSGAT